jgi:hypothetical protein
MLTLRVRNSFGAIQALGQELTPSFEARGCVLLVVDHPNELCVIDPLVPFNPFAALAHAMWSISDHSSMWLSHYDSYLLNECCGQASSLAYTWFELQEQVQKCLSLRNPAFFGVNPGGFKRVTGISSVVPVVRDKDILELNITIPWADLSRLPYVFAQGAAILGAFSNVLGAVTGRINYFIPEVMSTEGFAAIARSLVNRPNLYGTSLFSEFAFPSTDWQQEVAMDLSMLPPGIQWRFLRRVWAPMARAWEIYNEEDDAGAAGRAIDYLHESMNVNSDWFLAAKNWLDMDLQL